MNQNIYCLNNPLIYVDPSGNSVEATSELSFLRNCSPEVADVYNKNTSRILSESGQLATEAALDVLADGYALVTGKTIFGESQSRGVSLACLVVPEFVEAGGKTLAKHSDDIAGFVKGMGKLGKLTKKGDDVWESSAGLIYGADRKFGNRVKHVLAHGTPNPNKVNHTVFNVGGDDILALVDEAWTMKGNPLKNDPGAYLIDMGRKIGTNGETTIKIITKPGTSEIITAYPK